MKTKGKAMGQSGINSTEINIFYFKKKTKKALMELAMHLYTNDHFI